MGAFDHLDYKREDFVRKGARKGSVNVFFLSKIDGREYAVFRDSTGTYYVYDPELKIRLAQQKQEVVKWLCQQHGVELNTDLSILFRTTIGVPQGTFTYDFLQAPSKRKPVFDKILKVEEYFQAADELKELLRLIERKIASIREQIASNEGELKRYDEVETAYNNNTEKLLSAKTQYSDAKMERDITEISLTRFNSIKEKIDDLARKIQDLKLKIAEKTEREKNLLEEINRAKQATSLLINTEKNYLAYLSATEKLNSLEKERLERDKTVSAYASTEQQLVRIESNIQHLQETLNQIEQARLELSSLSTKIAEQDFLEKKLKEFERKQGEKEQVERNISKLNQDLIDLRQKYSDVSRSIEDAEKYKDAAIELTKLETEKHLLDKRLSNYSLTLTEIKHKSEQINSLEITYQKLQKERKILESRIFDIKKDINIDLPPIQELEENYQTKSSEAAQIRAFIERDERMQREIKNGLCPLLSERCLNMKEGQTLNSYFELQLTDQRKCLLEQEMSLKAITTQLTQARLALSKQGNLEALLTQLEKFQRDELICEKQLSQFREDLSLLGSSEQILDSKRADTARLQFVESELAITREKALKYAQLEPRRQRLSELKDEGTQTRKLYDSNSSRLAVLEQDLIEQPNIENKLIALNNPRATFDSLNRQIAREKDLLNNLDRQKQQYQQLTRQTAHLKTKIESYINLDKELVETNSLINQTRNDYNSFLFNQALASRLFLLEPQLENIRLETKEFKEQLDLLETDFIETSKKYSHDEHSKKRALLPNLIHKTAQLESELKYTETQQSRLSLELERLGEVKRRQIDKMAERDKLNELHELADFIRDCLRRAGPHITEAYLHTVSLEANQLYREISGNSLVSLRWELDYDIVLEEEGRDRPFHNLSGGEQMAAALSVRLALLKEFSELRFAFFDEPTTNMDEERRSNLAQQIGRIKDFEQLFIVTHDDSFEGFTDNIIQLQKPH
ncbi:MAG: hypothetical protein HY819_11905 [Acidobacteria bacterium]|nr:hypothetical protein [Acidobacteriota bacterium]